MKSHISKRAKAMAWLLMLVYFSSYLMRKSFDVMLAKICTDLVSSGLDEFYYSYRNQWNIENKPHGFDVQDIRIGGLYFRIKHCKEILEDFINGNIEKIPELEEMVLNPFLGSWSEEKRTFWFNNWSSNTTANVL